MLSYYSFKWLYHIFPSQFTTFGHLGYQLLQCCASHLGTYNLVHISTSLECIARQLERHTLKFRIHTDKKALPIDPPELKKENLLYTVFD